MGAGNGNLNRRLPQGGMEMKRYTQTKKRRTLTRSQRSAYFRGRLLEKRRELLHRLVSERQASADVPDSGPGDSVDLAVLSSEREASCRIASFESHAVHDIDCALERLENGTYNICEECGCRIPRARLRALPFASTCLRCKERLERERTDDDGSLPDWEGVDSFGVGSSSDLQDSFATIRGRRPS